MIRFPRERWLALMLFAIVVLGWGLTWVFVRTMVRHVDPIWSSAIRSAIGAAGLAALLALRGQFIVPRRGDVPVVIVACLFHTVAYSVLITIGLKYVPVGRSIVLGYTMPLWVAPGAWLFLGETVPRKRLIGIAIGLAGLVLMFNPLAFDWTDRAALLGNGVLLLSAVSWSVSIVYLRGHAWISSPFQLLFWQAALATIVLLGLARAFEGVPAIAWTGSLVASFAYTGLVGSALAFWAMNEVSRRLPASTTALGILATPVVGIAASSLFLGERVDPMLLLAAALILAGIGIGTTARG
jgi:drug/metabolite transporter (DMT)-like permease